MKHIYIKLTDKYKSLEANYEFDFYGNLIVLSGINGSGKSHLADAFMGISRKDANHLINRDVSIDDSNCIPGQVIIRTFSDAAHLGDVNQTAAQLTTSYKETIWNSYISNRLNSNDPNTRNYRLSADKAKAILIDQFSEYDFNNGNITREQIMRTIPSDFAWLPDDIFQNSVLQIFYSYAKKDEFFHAQNDRGIQTPTVGNAPWKTLNQLFKNLGFEYRFREDYQLNSSGELNHPVVLHPIKSNGSVDTTEERSLS